MSVATYPSPSNLRQPKRLLEEDTASLGPLQQQAKRSRIQRSPQPAARCGLPFHYQQHQGGLELGVGGASDQLQAYSALLALFPGMDDKVVQGVLVECNYSIDAAIKRLTDLRLSTEDATVAAATAAASTPTSDASDASGSATAVDAAAAAAAQQQPQAQPADAPQAASDAATAEAPQGPQTADQWIEYLVVEMLASKDMTDARSRAAGVLQHFEQFVKTRQKHESDAKIAELVRENGIFKRAVQIQAQRLAQAKQAAEEELAATRLALAQHQEQCRKLELHAYSLAMHLQQATSSSGSGLHQRHPPDVF